jgi:general secretion pathway protein G
MIMQRMLYRSINTLLIIACVACLVSCGAFKADQDKIDLSAREEMLRQDLLVMRKMIDAFDADHAALPQGLEDLVKSGYLRQIPDDPITGKKDWKIVIGDDTGSAKGGKGIVDVYSASTARSSKGTPYNEW